MKPLAPLASLNLQLLLSHNPIQVLKGLERESRTEHWPPNQSESGGQGKINENKNELYSLQIIVNYQLIMRPNIHDILIKTYEE